MPETQGGPANMTVQNTLWVEKYRPETLDDIVGHDDIINRMERYTTDEEVPHMIFSGPAGVGKTASITAFAKEVFGDSWRSNLTEMNASDKTGIDTIRDEVKGIARQNPTGGADYKIIFLDEADQLSNSAQPALRRIMEDYSDVTRFFLSCNWISEIIEPLQSRCSVFRFTRLDDEEIREVMMNVIEQEGLDYEDFAIDVLINESNGDARSAIGNLQSAAVNDEITEDSVKTVVGSVQHSTVEEIIDLAIAGEMNDAMTQLDVELLKEGASPQRLCEVFLKVVKRKNMPAPGKMKVIDKIAETEWRIQHGSNPQVQLHSLLTDINVGYHLDFGEYES